MMEAIQGFYHAVLYRVACVKTWTTTVTFGHIYLKDKDLNAVNCWPSIKDILEMPISEPVELDRIDYRTRGRFFNQIRVYLTNGISSPWFKAPSQEQNPDGLSEVKTLKFARFAKIEAIRGTKNRDGKCVTQVHFWGDDKEVAGQMTSEEQFDMEECGNPIWPDEG
jgi:hypothetical protein